MFARFHHPIRPKAIVTALILTNLCGDVFAFPTELDDLVLKSTSASEIQQTQKQKEMLTEIKGDEESHSFKAAEKSTHKATMLESDTKASSFSGSCFAPDPPLAPPVLLLSPLFFDTRNSCCINVEIPCSSWIASFSHFTVF
jgi:hypothetical protein